MTKPILIFLHVPKTGGVTMRRIMEKQYRKKELLRITPHFPANGINQLSIREQRKVKAMYGHFPYGIHTRFHRPTTYMTFIRHPFQRVVSLYNYICSRSQNPAHIPVKKISFAEFIDDPRFQVPLQNHQVRLISGDLRKFSLGEAMDHLQRHFSVVGITDLYPESLEVMKQRYGWRDVNYTRENKSVERVRKQDVPDRLRRLIIQRNQLDLELYRHCREELINQHRVLT
ncbi:sulfotransferase family protein [Mechercharimyces sp. CAU 1602]|uniref:sulfotransferase family protein n=1 Tax=Mechercharimyces sp. CAU 1602 TaxID=2973933 RepID=UPI002163726D|nr:sulfotransferase family protein [Mechercharimyces sp. CAU 1602]MCS1351836.1 sulfotransferase family protein [Mechercharimyces sp. CAU 1602]